MATTENSYAARLDIDYPPKLNRLTTFFRFILAIPIIVILVLITGASGSESFSADASQTFATSGGGIIVGLSLATGLMIIFRKKYPRWWFNFNLELNRFTMRINAYLMFLTDKYPSTVDKQAVQLDIDYPNAKKDLHNLMPLVKWLIALPHYIVLFGLTIAAIVVTIIAWFAILFTGTYPKSLFDFVVGVNRWNLRVNAYALLLVTDKYPPFSLK
jgi:hypothetical protein